MLAVVLVSAAIRLNGAGIEPLLGATGLAVLRGIHRATASLALLAALWLAWLDWRRAALIVVLTALLSLLGIVAGRTPTPLQALGNLLGGLALAASFAWLLGKKGSGTFSGKRFLTPFLLLALFAVQSVIGGRLSIVSRVELPGLPLHALLGIVLAAFCAWLALARIGATAGRLLFFFAVAAPLAGFTALEHPYSAVPALVHAATGAFLIALAAFAAGRNA